MIRTARAEDRDALYDICLRTGASGADASDQFEDPDLLGHVYVGPYLALAPEHALVVTSGASAHLPGASGSDLPAGYALGVADTRAFVQACEWCWWPSLRRRYPIDVARPPADRALVALIHDPTPTPDDLLADFPAHLHIDLLPVLQGRGIAAELLDRLLDSLRAAGAVGVHLGVDPANRRAIAFYRRMGLHVLREQPDRVLMGRALHPVAGG